jgi:catalase
MSLIIDTKPTALVDALNDTFGRHAGRRASHAKGFCAIGEFIPDPDATTFIDNAMFAQPRLTAIIRFSVGGGNPAASDKSRSVRGLSVRLSSATQVYDLVMLSEPVFFAATLESFVGFLRARVPDPATGKPDPAKVASYQAEFPDGKRQPALLASHAAPASYATTPYFSNNAFLFRGRDGNSSPARLVFQPDAGTAYLSAEAETTLSDDFLESELDKRLLRGPIGFRLFAQLPGAGDSLVDPSTLWVGSEKVFLGKLLVTALSDNSCDSLSFVPTNLPSAIALTDDPILQARRAAYAVSENRRTLTNLL